ncbi:hypothetical protein FB451DRAFT_1506987 [Mycena latifolia]|nr:hypothetical protein FB451DRAFT_1506987 [Mycena latifolia]
MSDARRELAVKTFAFFAQAIGLDVYNQTLLEYPSCACPGGSPLQAALAIKKPAAEGLHGDDRDDRGRRGYSRTMRGAERGRARGQQQRVVFASNKSWSRVQQGVLKPSAARVEPPPPSKASGHARFIGCLGLPFRYRAADHRIRTRPAPSSASSIPRLYRRLIKTYTRPLREVRKQGDAKPLEIMKREARAAEKMATANKSKKSRYESDDGMSGDDDYFNAGSADEGVAGGKERGKERRAKGRSVGGDQ